MATKLRDMVRKVRNKLSDVEVATTADEHYEKYPWGLRLNLNDEEITKLDLNIKNMSVDDMVKIEAVAYVESIRQSKNRRGEDRNIELQITKMSVKKKKS